MTAHHPDVASVAVTGDPDPKALSRLLPLVYDELRTLADRYLRQERPNHTLQATALVHEAYMRMAEQKDVQWRNRAQFFAVAASFMRRILVNHAKRRNRVKRGGDRVRFSLEDELVVSPEPNADLVAIDEALTRLAVVDPQKARIVELRYFAGLTIAEVSEVLKISPATVKRHWDFAKAWLLREVEVE